MYPIFNIRVYGLLINAHNEVLVTDEFRFGKEMTKFPGGGLRWGEGMIDCLKRECREELGCEIEIVKHFYTTDFFQQSAFHADHQLISIYYLVKEVPPALKGEKTKILFAEKHEPNHPFRDKRVSQSFRWIPISKINPDDFTFPVDKKVARMLNKDYSKSL